MAGGADFVLDTCNARAYVMSRPDLADRIGAVRGVATIEEGKLNGVLVVEGERESAVLKQSLPWIRTIPDWSLDAGRLQREVELLRRWASFNSEFVPEVWAYDESANIVAMEYLGRHSLLRDALSAPSGPDVSAQLGAMIARAAYHTSPLALEPGEFARAVDASRNGAMTALMHDVVFAMPFFGPPLEMPTEIAAAHRDRFRQDDRAIEAIRLLSWEFDTRCESLLHGDLHVGSIMVSGADVRVIDAEFGRYGPVAWDLGELLGHFMIAAQVLEAQGEHEAGARARGMIETAGETFRSELLELAKRSSLPKGETLAANWAREAGRLAVRFGGVEILRRIIGVGSCEQLQHLPEAVFCTAMETLVETGRRAVVEGRW